MSKVSNVAAVGETKSDVLSPNANLAQIGNNWNDPQNSENQFYFLENPDFDVDYNQSSEPEIFNEYQFFNSTIKEQNQKQEDINESSKSKLEINNSNASLNINFDQEEQEEKNDLDNNIIYEKKLSNSFNFFSFKNQNLQNYLIPRQNFNYYNYQNNIYSSQNIFINTDFTTKKNRKKRGTGDEALKRHPNDDFHYENKPCYNFLVSLSNDIYRKKCTFDIISRVACIIEELNPSIEKRTRMERRRKSVQLFWFHSNWSKISKMKNRIIEKLKLT